VQLKVDHAPFETGSITTYALDDGHGSVWPIARRRLDPSARTSFAPEEVDALERAARLEPIEEDRPLALPGGHLELRFEMPTNAIRFFRIRRAAR
jgi:hypothetical protein